MRPICQVRVVGDHKQGDTVFVETLENVNHVIAGRAIQIARRLIGE